jgi:hypothetical protein
MKMMDIRDGICGSGVWMKLAENHIRWRALLVKVCNIIAEGLERF